MIGPGFAAEASGGVVIGFIIMLLVGFVMGLAVGVGLMLVLI